MKTEENIALIKQQLSDFKIYLGSIKELLDVNVTTAKRLSAAEYQSISVILTEKLGREILLNKKVDPSILGGIIVQVGDKVFDASALRKLKDSNGQYLWQPSLQAGQPDRLLGYEIYTSPYAPTLAAGALSIAFGDFQSYWIADRTGRTVQRLNELYSTNGQVGFVATERVDGKIILPEGIQLLKMKAA